MTQDTNPKLLAKVQALYDAARGETTEEARNTFLKKADALVREYALEAALADMNAQNAPEEVVSVSLDIDTSGEWGGHVQMIMSLCAEHNDTYPVMFGGGRMHLIGFQNGIDFTQMMFATLQIHFLRNLEPGWDPELGLDENVYMLKTSGMKWRRIRDMAVRNGHVIPWTEKSQDGRRLIKAYRRHCEAIGVEPTHQTQSHDTYRDAFAMAYCSRLRALLAKMRNDYNPDEVAEGAAVALQTRMQRVMSEVYRLYPHLHPEEQARKARESDARYREWWDGLTKEEQKRILRESRSFRAPRETLGKMVAREAGREAGRAAADSANLNPGRDTVAAPNRKAIG